MFVFEFHFLRNNVLFGRFFLWLLVFRLFNCLGLVYVLIFLYLLSCFYRWIQNPTHFLYKHLLKFEYLSSCQFSIWFFFSLRIRKFIFWRNCNLRQNLSIIDSHISDNVSNFRVHLKFLHTSFMWRLLRLVILSLRKIIHSLCKILSQFVCSLASSMDRGHRLRFWNLCT